MPPRTSWRSLLPGLLALAVLVTTAVGLIVFGGVGRIRGETIRLYVLTNQAQNVIGGTEVWLVGQKVGTVDRVEFAPPGSDTAARVVLHLTVREEDIGQLRHDSEVQVRVGGNIIGPVIVSMASGSPTSPPAREGDTLRARAQSDMVQAGGKLSGITAELGPIMADVKTVLAQARSRSGSVRGPLMEQHDGEVAQLRGNVTRLRELFTGATKGSPATTHARGVMTHARLALAHVDSIRALVNSPSTSLGRFRRDSALASTVEEVRAELTLVRAKLEQVDGNFGRMNNDDAMTRAVADAQREMALLFADIRRRPGKYIAF
jgi:hypothetical protein